MKKILLPAKTFNLFKQGKRAFVHVPRTEFKEGEFTYGEKLQLINKENEQEVMEVTFSFRYDFKELDFIFIVFHWSADRTDNFFRGIANTASRICSDKPTGGATSSLDICTEFSPNYKLHLYSQLQAYSALLMIDSEPTRAYGDFLNINFEQRGGANPKKTEYVILDSLGLKTGHKVFSLFPVQLLGR